MSNIKNCINNRNSVLAVLVVCTVLTACTRFYSADKFVEEAKSYEKKGDEKSALIQLKNALQKDPNHKPARILMGELYLLLGDGYSAENEFRKAVKLGVPQNQLEAQIARAMLLEGHFKKCLDEISASGENLSAELLAIQGEAYYDLRESAKAKESFEQALKKQPGLSSALLGLAKLSMMEPDVDKAMHYVSQALDSAPQNVEAWLFKGKVYLYQSNTTDALASFDQALKIQPHNFGAHIEKANIEIKLKKYDDAESDIKSALDTQPKNPYGQYVQATLYFVQGKNHEALDALGTVLKSAPRFLPAILLSGAVNFTMGATTQAEAFLKQYLEEVPGNLYARKLLAQCQIKNGNPGLALSTLEVAIKNGNRDDSGLYSLAGESALKMRDFNKANLYFEQANAIEPENAGIHNEIAMEKAFTGDDKVAISELEKAISLNDKTTFPKSVVMLAMAYMKTGEFDKALETIGLLEKEQPNNPLAQNLKGIIYMKKNDPVRARTSFEAAVKLQPSYFGAVANLAQLDLQDKNFNAANERMLALLKIDKNNLNAELALASVANLQGNNKETEKWLTKALDDHPKQAEVAQPLIAFYLKNKETQKALTLARNLQAAAPDSPDFLLLLARTQQAGDDRQGAISSYAKLAGLRPDAPDAQLALATAYLNANDETNAREALKKALLIKPNYFYAQAALADLNSRSGQFDAALKIAKQVQAQDPKNPQGFLLEGDILMRQNKFIPAAASYQSALGLNKSSPVLIKLHNALVKGQKDKEASQTIENWLKEHQDDTQTRQYYATYLLSGTQSKLPAIAQLKILLKSDPNNPVVLNNLAWACDHEKDPNAITYAEQAYSQAKSNPQILDTYGWILAQRGDYVKALPLLQQSAKLTPADGEIHYHLAFTLLKTGDKVQARKELEAIVKGKDFSSMSEAQKMLKQLST